MNSTEPTDHADAANPPPDSRFDQSAQVVTGPQTNISEQNLTTQTNIYGDVNAEGGFINTGQIDTHGGTFVAGGHHVHFAAAKALPLHVNVPPIPNDLIGRTELIEQMVTALCTPTHKAFALTGLPGVGKSALAIALAHHPMILTRFPDGVLWASLGPELALSLLLGQWAAALGEEIVHLSNDQMRAQVVKDAIARRHLLVIIDDVWTVESVQLLQASGSSCYLLTTRNLLIAETFAGAQHTFYVPTLHPEPAAQLLATLAPKAYNANPTVARQLVQMVGGLPLAIRLLGGYLTERKGRHRYFAGASQTALYELIDPNRRLQLAQQRLGARDRISTNLQELIELSLHGLPLPVAQAFYCLGAFAPQPEWFTLDAAVAVSGLDADGLSLLLDANLLTLAEEERLTLHQTIADVARARMPAEAMARHREFYLALVNAGRQQWQQIEYAYGQIKWAWAALPAGENLLAYIEALHTYQRRRGLWEDAVAWSQRGLQQSAEPLPYKERAQLLNFLGAAYTGQRRWVEAIGALEESVAIRRRLGDQASVAGVLHALGNAYKGQGQLDQAKAVYEESLLLRRALGDRRGEGRILHNLGSVYASLDKWEGAIQLYEQSLAIKREMQDREGEGTTLNGMAQFYVEQGRGEEAIPFYEQSLQIKRDLGDRVGESNTLKSLADVYKEQQRWYEAIPLYERNLQIVREMQDKYQEGRILNNLGIAYQEQGQWEAALGCYEVSLQRKLAFDTPKAAQRTMNNLEQVYLQQQIGPQAITLWTRVLAALPADSPMYAQLAGWIQKLQQ